MARTLLYEAQKKHTSLISIPWCCLILLNKCKITCRSEDKHRIILQSTPMSPTEERCSQRAKRGVVNSYIIHLYKSAFHHTHWKSQHINSDGNIYKSLFLNSSSCGSISWNGSKSLTGSAMYCTVFIQKGKNIV